MGQTIARLSEKILMGEDRSNLQECKGMLHDDAELNITVQDGGDVLEVTPKTPPNVVKLKYDPRSPSDFDRTPIKIPLDGGD